MLSLFGFISTLQGLLFSVMLHPLHVSVTEIEMDEKEKRLEIMMRVFADDLETSLREDLKQPAFDIEKPDATALDAIVGSYLKKHFTLTLDNKAHAPKYLGHELEGDAYIFYIEVTGVKKWKTIQVRNDIIMEAFDDQSNLVHVTVRGTVRSLRLTKSVPADKLTFDVK
ncbi:DUF6702 family protein [Chryseolinea lacunae]|uniref:Peptidase S12 Pab87-related C-terminal domain-containing protein n=1 Tax=Chryseolinea lacunae TaxID=2801331 RepID=A0ABS1KQW0_9BACT|nr:DUF6702 family protein [Chryseolinea lacunae]MBL0741597.1 hypothetical protein [Chryseolinea lacunae]